MAAESSGEVPDALACPECRGLLKNATQLPCCKVCLCRPCAYKKLMMNKKKCWVGSTPACLETLQLNALSPALEIRELVQDYLDGGTKFKDTEKQENDSERVVEDEPEYVDCIDVTVPYKPIVTVKTETNVQEEEYSELSGGSVDLSRIKLEGGMTASSLLVPGAALQLPLPAGHSASSEYMELPLPVRAVVPKQEVSEQKEDDLDEGEEEGLFLKQPTTLPNTPSSARTEHTSSGYWSDDSFQGPFFGKLHWGLEDPTQGYIECWDDGVMKRAYVSRLDVKCGAESGDLVEFTLRSDSSHGKVARRVKLVEKGLPVSEEDQIRSQSNLKRSLELTARSEEESCKKIKTEDVIDAEIQLQSMSSSYMDIAADEEPPFSWHHAPIKPEMSDLVMEPASDTCICSSSTLARCGLCPVYFLRSESQQNILEGESVTFLAKVEGSGDTNLQFVRHLPFPFLIPHGSLDFRLLSQLGSDCIVKKVTPVFKENYVFVSVMNNTEFNVSISPGTILGSCQSHHVKDGEVSQHFIQEPPDRQLDIHNIPVYVKRKDFSRYEENHVCGFAELGSADMNYKYCLVKIQLLPELRNKFMLLKDEITVQVKRNVWLELIPQGRGYENLLPKSGVVGYAASVMDEGYVEDSLRTVSPVANIDADNQQQKTEPSTNSEQSAEDAYESLIINLEKDISSQPDGKVPANLNLLDKTFRGATSELVNIIPGSERTLGLLLHSDDELDPKSLLKMQVEVSNNEEFKYYNNCYNIEPQVCTVVNLRSKFSESLEPGVRVTVGNPRGEVATLPPHSSIALVRIHRVTAEPGKPSRQESKVEPAVEELKKKAVTAAKNLEKMQRRCLRSWERILSENTFAKSLDVEEKYPYFTAKPRPKIPFGLNLNHLIMRVGLNQDSRPTRVFDKISGVFSCTICDALILDKYSFQDHIYSDKHKENMKLVQVIAGPEERLFINRPVMQEMLDQFNGMPLKLLGLDHLFEVLQEGGEWPVYHCALCSVAHNERDIMHHLVSTNHTFNFIKEFFPVGWARLSPRHMVQETWTDLDLECYMAIIQKLDSVYGQRKPSIVESEEKYEDVVDKIPVNQYTSGRAELDTFFKNLKFEEEVSTSHLEESKTRSSSRTITRVVVVDSPCSIQPEESLRISCKITNVPKPERLDDKFVLITKNPSNTLCDIRPALSRVTRRNTVLCMVNVTVFNAGQAEINLTENTDIAIARWKK